MFMFLSLNSVFGTEEAEREVAKQQKRVIDGGKKKKEKSNWTSRKIICKRKENGF